MNSIKREIIKRMERTASKKTKSEIPSKKVKRMKNTKGQKRAAEYVSYLLELHKLQGVLLIHLDKELR